MLLDQQAQAGSSSDSARPFAVPTVLLMVAIVIFWGGRHRYKRVSFFVTLGHIDMEILNV